MRIIAGKHRGRVLKAPEGMNTRPTSDRAREAVFNILESWLLRLGKSWSEIEVLDAFAGTGALGIEAVSRGALKLHCIEKDSLATACLKENLKIFAKDNVSISLSSDALFPPQAIKPAGLIFMDPPYQKNLAIAALTALNEKGWIDSDTICIVEIEKSEPDPLPKGFCIKNERIYGKARILFIQQD